MPSVHSIGVSPPDSPQLNEAAPTSRRSSLNVSPIIELPRPSINRFPKGSHQGSSIPVPTKAHIPSPEWRGIGAGQPERGSALSFLTRWDDFSGEPTTSETGKPAQATAGAVDFKPGETIREGVGLFQNNRTFNSESPQGSKNFSSKQSNPAFIPKETWKGGSGRHTIINPLLDKPLPPGKTASFPPGAQKIPTNPRDSSVRKSAASTQIQPTHRKPVQPPGLIINTNSMVLSNTGVISDSRLINYAEKRDPTQSARSSDIRSPISTFMQTTDDDHNQQSKVVEATSRGSVINGNFDQLRALTPSTHPTTENLRSTSPSIRKVSAEIQRKNFLLSPDATPGRVPSESDLEAIENDFRAKMHNMRLEDQPLSRFSATTCATTVYDSPPATPNPSPESPSPTPPPSILNRKRPVRVAGIPNPKLSARKPTPQELGKSLNPHSTDGLLSKSLPKSPPEEQATTRVASLEAKLDNLRRRRGNLRTVIHELTNVVQPSSIAYDTASRQEIKRTVDGLHEELAEVVKEEHETGLQLHRAWKRQDTDSAYENSSLWVKRLLS